MYKKITLSPAVSALLILLIVIITDIIFRFKEMQIWSKNYIGFYLLSVLMAYCFYYSSIQISSLININWQKNIINLAIASFIALSLIGSLAYRIYFGSIPTIFTFQLLFEEPGEALVSVQNEFSMLKIITIIGLIAAFFLLLKKGSLKIKKFSKVGLGISILLFGGSWAVLNNQVRFVDQCFTLDTNILITTGKILQNSFSKNKFNRSGMHAGNRPKFTTSGKAPGFNLLVIINESVRSKSFQLNDSTLTKMPQLASNFRQNRSEYFVFPNAYGTATTTMVAFPTALCGANSQTEVSAMHKLPLLWNYSDKFDCDQYLISSHIYYWRNFISFVSDKSLEKIWYQEISGYSVTSGSYGIEDRYSADTLLSCIDKSVNKSRNFMAVLHTCDQHFPYFYPEKKTNSHTYADYLNSQKHLDNILGKIETHLKDKNISDNTIIIFTSDHGEAFGEHGQFSHIGIVYREAASVAFYLKIPLKLQSKYNLTSIKNNLNKTVSNSDLAPTIIDLYNLRNDAEVNKIITQLPGTSILQPIAEKRKVIVSSNTEYAVLRDDHALGIYGQNESMIFNFRGGQPQFEYFDLRSDPDQKKNVWKGLSDSAKLEYEKIFITNINLKRTYDMVIKKSFINF